MKKVLTIAGSDCSGGAGIQADIKTVTAHRLYAMSVITSLTAQNTLGVNGVFDISPEFVGAQLDSVFTDIAPDSVKIGMVSNSDIITVIDEKLSFYGAKNIVVDPVMVSTSGSNLINPDAMEALSKRLFPHATIITPNIPEAERLCGMTVNSEEDMKMAADRIARSIGNTAVLIKGGHNADNANDLLCIDGEFIWFNGEKFNNSNTHGTGCTLSSAIACNLALGFSVAKSVENAKRYVAGAIKDGLNIGNGRGPLNHCYNLKIIGEA